MLPIDDFSVLQNGQQLPPYHKMRAFLFWTCYAGLLGLGSVFFRTLFLARTDIYTLSPMVLWLVIVVPPFLFYPYWIWASWQYQRGTVSWLSNARLGWLEVSLVLSMLVLIPLGFCSCFALLFSWFLSYFSIALWAFVTLLICLLLGPIHYKYVQHLINLKRTIFQ